MTIMVGKALATVSNSETLTSGMVNAKIKFEFSSDWDGFSKTAIFVAGDVSKVVLDAYWDNGVCSIPQECLETSGEILMVGVYGADNANTVAVPTVWATVGKIRKGYEGFEDVSTGTLPIWAQVQSSAAQSAQAAQDAQAAAETAQGKAEDAQTAAETAQTAAETAQTKAETAQEKAEAAQAKAETAQKGAENAQAAAASSASVAASYASTATTAASAANESAESAAEHEAGAQAAAATATAAITEAKSWAVGGTGTRDGEDTNNAKYWAHAAQGAAGGGVTSFNGRSGAVAPQAGDYTADMVGADAAGAAAAVLEIDAARVSNNIMAEDGGCAINVENSAGLSVVQTLENITQAGVYTLYVQKGCPDNPELAETLKSSLRGICHITLTKDFNGAMYAWIVLFDKYGNMYTRYTSASESTWYAQQNALTFDSTPTLNSTNPITSGGVATALEDLPKALTGSGAPTTSTVGVVGQMYVNTTDGSIYACSAVSGSTYTWKLKTWVTETQLNSGLATKQDASTAITTSNIGSQTVNKAKLATDDVAVGTPGLRNQYFSSTEQTPTVDGQICWVYG